MASTPEQTAPNPEELRAAIASGDPVQAMPALAKLRALPDSDNDSVVIPLLILGSKQQAFLVRSLSCSGLGYRRNEQGWQVLTRLVSTDDDPNVRAHMVRDVLRNLGEPLKIEPTTPTPAPAL